MSKHLLIWLLASPWDMQRGLITSAGSHRDGGALSTALPSSQPLPWDIPVLGKRASRQETPPKGTRGVSSHPARQGGLGTERPHPARAGPEVGTTQVGTRRFCARALAHSRPAAGLWAPGH